MDYKKYRRTEKRSCFNCGKVFDAVISEIKRGKGRVCSLSCALALSAKNRDQSKERNPNWRGGVPRNTRDDRYRKLHPDKAIAHQMITHGLRNGKIIKQPCEVCQSIYVEAHHDDYTKPLEVRWLCKKHHLDVHGGRFGTNKR